MKSLKASLRRTPAPTSFPTLQLTPARRPEFGPRESQDAPPEAQTETPTESRSAPPKRLTKDEKGGQKPVADGFFLDLRQRQPGSGVAQALQYLAAAEHTGRDGDEKTRAALQRSVDALWGSLVEKGRVVEPGSCHPVQDGRCAHWSSWDEARSFIRYARKRRCFVVPRRRARVLPAVARPRKQRAPRTPDWRSALAKSPLWVCTSPDDRERLRREAKFYRAAYRVLVARGFKLPFRLPTDPVRVATLVCILAHFVQTLLRQKRNQ